jgi:hypothetical protein
MTTYETDKQAAENAALREANTSMYETWLITHPQINPCDANRLMFEGYFDYEERELTAADFDFGLSNLKDHLALQKVPTPEQIVAAENKHRKSLNLPQLHELSRKENPLPQRGELPSTWFDNDISTAAALRALAKSNIASFKALVSRFGTQAVDERLGVQQTAQVGRSFRMKI